MEQEDTKDLVRMIKEVKEMREVKPEVFDLLEEYGLAEKISVQGRPPIGVRFNNYFYVMHKESGNYVKLRTAIVK